ncbi:hypothetical protein DKX38_000873 [Salix brachista]|uniref:Uncharacterized protein n=1 Tax=Salix brachista TaxID=2182728 RepID=A0A5N5P2L8_9ROSI|nr:hypothetical protein DKX38_000873 [Salix brachista]
MSGRKETVLDLAKFVDKGVQVKLTGGRQGFELEDLGRGFILGHENTAHCLMQWRLPGRDLASGILFTLQSLILVEFGLRLGVKSAFVLCFFHKLFGVRREVGNHAKALNKMLPKTEVNSMVCSRDDLIGSKEGPEENLGALLSKEERPFLSDSTNPPVLLETENKTRQSSQRLAFSSLKASEEATENSVFLAIGHTEFEVIAGALLGFFVSVAVHTIL